jgi:PD-(D/E)XK nuclease superfamily
MTPAQFPRVLDATMRSAFLLCPHHFFRRHCQGLTHDRPSIHLHFGACLATGLEATRRAYCGGHSPSESLLIGSEAIIRAWREFEFPASPTRTEANKTLENCLLALNDYMREWPLTTDPIQIHHHNNEPCIEFSGVLPIPGVMHPETGEELLYCGRFDMIGDYQHSVWGLDDKTTGSSVDTDAWRSQWTLRGQFTGYTWLAQEYGLPLKGFLVRGIQILTASTKLGMAITPRPAWMVREWLFQLQSDANRMIHYWNRYRQPEFDLAPKIAFPRILDTGCFSYNRPCEHMTLCSSPDPARWESDYDIKFWNPLERVSE